MSRREPDEEARRWLEQSRSDLAFAELGRSAGFHAHACFLAQQAAEKALKAVHYARGARTVLGHSAAALLDSLQLGPEAEPLRADAAELDLHYVPARYPNGLPGGIPSEVYTAVQADAALAAARRILETARSLLTRS